MNAHDDSLTASIPFKEKVGYGLADFGSQFIYTTSTLFLVYFLTDVALLAPALVGVILLTTRIWDAVIDPFLGYFSDHVQTRWGQKRPFLLFTAIPLGLSLLLVYNVPDLAGNGRFIYYMGATLLMWTIFSVFQIPSGAMLANLTLDARERSSIAGISKGMGMIGLVIIGGLTPVITNAFDSEATGYRVMAAIYGVIVAVSLLTAFAIVRERVQAPPEERYKTREMLRLLAGNTPFIVNIISLLLVFTVYTVTGAMLNYFFEYNMGEPGFVSIALTAVFGIAALSMPAWIWIFKRVGKKPAYIASMVIYGVIFLILYTVESFNPWVIIPLFVIAGFGFAGINLGTVTLTPDTVEYTQWKYGKRVEGAINGVGSFILTLASSLGGFIIGVGLEYFGYVANVPQTEQALQGIRVLTTLLPPVLLLLAIIALLFYPITEKFHAKMLSDIEAKKPAAQKV